MALLLDTHVVVWWLRDDRRLRPRVRAAIEEHLASGSAFVSALTGLEIASIRGGGFERAIHEFKGAVEHSGFRVLSFDLADALHAAELPAIHNDPIDRAIAGQAGRRQLTLMTADAMLARYPIGVFRV